MSKSRSGRRVSMFRRARPAMATAMTIALCACGAGSTGDVSRVGTAAPDVVIANGPVGAVSGVIAARIGSGRAVVAASADDTTLVATTVGVNVGRGDDWVELSTAGAGSIDRVSLSPDGSVALLGGQHLTDLWSLKGSPRLVESTGPTTSFAVTGQGEAITVSPTRVRVVDGTSGSVSQMVDAPGSGVFGPLAVGDGPWWVVPLSGNDEPQVLVSVDGGDPGVVPLGIPGDVIVRRSVADPSARRVVFDLADASDPFVGKIVMWDIDTRRPVWSVVTDHTVDSQAWDVGIDGRVLIANESGARVIAATGVETTPEPLDADSPPVNVAAMRTGDFLILRRDGSRHVVDADGRPVSGTAGSGRSLTSVQPSPDRATVMTVVGDGAVSEVAADGSVTRRIDDFVGGVVNDIAISADSDVAIATSTGSVTFGSTDDLDHLAALVHPEGNVDSVSFSPDGGLLVTGISERRGAISFDDTVSIWNPADGQRLNTIGGEAEDVAGCAFFDNLVEYAGDGSFVATASHDFTVALLDGGSGEVIHTFPPHLSSILGIAISPDDSMLVTTSDDSTLRVWDLATHELIAEHQTTMGGFWSVSYLPDGTLLVSDITGQLFTYEPSSGTVITTFASTKSRTTGLAVSPDGQLAVAGEGMSLRIWSVDTGRVVGELHGHSGGVTTSAFTSSGTRLVTGSEDGTAIVWDLARSTSAES